MMQNQTNSFADEIDTLLATPREVRAAAPVTAPVGAGGLYVEQCLKCRGTGRFLWNGGQCFACKGKGSKSFVQPATVRADNRTKSESLRERNAAAAVLAFAAEHPAEHAYLDANRATNEFCASLYAAIGKWGQLTEKQLAAATAGAERATQREAERAAVAQAVVETAPTVNVDAVTAAFESAKAKGLKRPTIRLPGVTLSLAGETSRNPGAIYAKAEGLGTYLGKIVGGKFFAARECTAAAQEAVRAALVDPLAQAVAYGRQTGSCSCCGRELTDPVSIAAGIGPICANKFGW